MPSAPTPLIALPGVTPKSVTAMNEIERGMLLSVIWSKLTQLAVDVGAVYLHASDIASAVAALKSELKAELRVMSAVVSSRPNALHSSPDSYFSPPILQDVTKDRDNLLRKALPSHRHRDWTTSSAADEVPLLSSVGTLDSVSAEELAEAASPVSIHRRCCPPARMFEGAWHKAFGSKVQKKSQTAFGCTSTPNLKKHGVQTPPRPTKMDEFRYSWDVESSRKELHTAREPFSTAREPLFIASSLEIKSRKNKDNEDHVPGRQRVRVAV